MRFSELASKEIINMTNGVRLGPVGSTDLVIDPHSGEIQCIVVPPRGRWSKETNTTEIPWSAIRRVGPEVIIVDVEQISGMPRPSGRP